jgi:hypothetical protein
MNQNDTTHLISDDANLYSINTADIWENEKSIVFSEYCNETIAINLLTNLREIIELKGECDFHFESYEKGDDSFKDYYSRKMNLFLDSHLDFKELCSIDFFFDAKGNCFSFHTPIEITKNDSNFDYWFALYLRQFDNNIIEIDNFLNFQLLGNFENNYREFKKFLVICLRQYGELISSKVMLTSQEWLENHPYNKSQTRRNNKGVESNYIPKRSFKLKGVEDFNSYFEKKVMELPEIMKDLKKEFVHDTTKIQQLKDILSGIEIKSTNRINWIGSFKELNMFVSILNYDLNKIEPLKNGIWEIACFCFTKNGKEISVSQLSNANGKETKRLKLFSILEKL